MSRGINVPSPVYESGDPSTNNSETRDSIKDEEKEALGQLKCIKNIGASAAAGGGGGGEKASSCNAPRASPVKSGPGIPPAAALTTTEGICRRPIYPNFPFSPFTSPGTSPFARRRKFKESQRVSVEMVGDDVQLNQYRLKDPIGQGSYGIVKLVYNEEDEQNYVSKYVKSKLLNTKDKEFFETRRFFFAGHEDFVKKETLTKGWDI